MTVFQAGDPISTLDGDRLGKVIRVNDRCIDVQWGADLGDIRSYTHDQVEAYQFRDARGIIDQAISVWAAMQGYDWSDEKRSELADKVIDLLEFWQ